MLNSYDKGLFHFNCAYSYLAFFRYKGNFLLGARHNKLLEYPVSRHTYVYSLNGNPVFYYKFLWMDYIKKINFLKKLYGSNSDLWFITNRFEFLGLLDAFAKDSRANIFHYNARRMFQEGYVGVAETLNFRMKLMGIENTAGFTRFHKSSDKFYFLVNNERRDKLFLDEMCEDGYNNEPRLCISVANTNSLFVNTWFYGLFGNTIPMSSKYFFFNLLKRCSGSVITEDDDTHYVRSFTKFLNYGSSHYFRKAYLTAVQEPDLSPAKPVPFFNPAGFIAKTLSPKSKFFTIRFNHIHNRFVVKKLFRYFHTNKKTAASVHRSWRLSLS